MADRPSTPFPCVGPGAFDAAGLQICQQALKRGVPPPLQAVRPGAEAERVGAGAVKAGAGFVRAAIGAVGPVAGAGWHVQGADPLELSARGPEGAAAHMAPSTPVARSSGTCAHKKSV